VRALVLQHIASETPGIYEDILVGAGIELVRVEVDAGEALPALAGADLIVAMGGPMSVNDESSLPWLAEEKRVVGEAVRGGMPFWGVCLGAQLLAAVLGARAYPGPRPEIGVLPVHLTPLARADPVFAALPEDLMTLQWHSETFDLPAGAVLLATSPAYSNQAFRWGPHAYGVQFHLEVTPEMVEACAVEPEYAAALESALGAGALPRILAELRMHGAEMTAEARGAFTRWLESSLPACRPTDRI
jgi:GMP synthase (glutamine-hydrolysing)